jgi:sterol 3beta-glucosyltransferase
LRVSIISVGSRGDVHPLIGFAHALIAAGHEVRFAAFPKFEGDVRAAGLEYAPLAEGRLSRTPQQDAAGRRAARGSARRTPVPVQFVQEARAVARRRLADALAASERADAIVGNELAMLIAWQVAEHRGVPLVRVRYSPPPRLAGSPAAGAVRQAGWLVVRPWLGTGRRELGMSRLPLREPLARLQERRTLELYAISPAVLPDPARKGPYTHLTGYWFLDDGLDPEPPQPLLDFLADGPAPVCVGFGTMQDDDKDVRATSELVLAALRRAGQRGVLLGGLDAGPAGAAQSAIAVPAVSHGWLFERCAAVVHHGGAGTVAAALRAGVPSVVVPHMMDQHGWGRRLHATGVAPAAIPRRRLSAARLGEAIAAAAGEPSMRERARELARRIRDEDGIARAVEVFERHMDGVAGRAVSEVINS